MTTPRTLRIAAAIAVDEAGRLLLVRKRGTDAFMQPGGKLEPGEDGAVCLIRELHEELGLELTARALSWVGRFRAPAANEPGFAVDCDMFRIPAPERIEVRAELAEAQWVDPPRLHALAAAGRLAPLTRDCVVPVLDRLVDGAGPIRSHRESGTGRTGRDHHG